MTDPLASDHTLAELKLRARPSICGSYPGSGRPAFDPDTTEPVAGKTAATLKRQAVVIVEPNLLLRAGLVHVLARTKFRVIGEGSSLSELPPDIFDSEPCLLLLAITGSISSTPDELGLLREKHSELRIILFYDDVTGAHWHPEIGTAVDAFLPKNGIAPDLLLKALELVMVGVTVCSRSVLQDVFTGAPIRDADPTCRGGRPTEDDPSEALQRRPLLGTREPGPSSLTAREQLILLHLMRGDSNKIIARELGIAEATVKIHVRNLMVKIDAKNRTQAAMWGMKNHV